MAPPSARRQPFQRQAPIAYLAEPESHDPRGYGQGYRPDYEADQFHQERVRRALAAGVVPLDLVLDALDAHNLPPQLKQATYLAIIPSFGVAGSQRLIPQNPRKRYSFLVSNFLGRNNVLFSYGRPVDTGAGVGAGIPIGNYYQEANGAVSIDDIWVFCNDPGETYPFTMLGYEGGIEVVGNKR